MLWRNHLPRMLVDSFQPREGRLILLPHQVWQWKHRKPSVAEEFQNNLACSREELTDRHFLQRPLASAGDEVSSTVQETVLQRVRHEQRSLVHRYQSHINIRGFFQVNGSDATKEGRDRENNRMTRWLYLKQYLFLIGTMASGSKLSNCLLTRINLSNKR